jgi:hypothetical protein
MQQDAHLFVRSVLVGALAIVSASCNSDPALVGQLYGDPAAKLADTYQPATPVLVAGADDHVVAIVFSKEQADLAPLLDELLIDEVEDCGSGGWFGREGWIGRDGAVLCCNPATNSFVINSERGWLHTGERCDASDANDDAANADSNGEYEPGIEFVQVDPQLSQLLEDVFGVNYRFMTLVGPDKEARALVNGPLPGQEHTFSDSTMQFPKIMASSQIIPAGHKKPTPAGGCVSSLGESCTTGGSGRCRKNYWHVYYKDIGSNQWCHFPPQCGC